MDVGPNIIIFHQQQQRDRRTSDVNKKSRTEAEQKQTDKFPQKAQG